MINKILIMSIKIKLLITACFDQMKLFLIALAVMCATAQHDHDMTAPEGDGTEFCLGTGTVMMNGFQYGYGSESYCILYLFPEGNVNTPTRYAFAIIGTFVMAGMVEALVALRTYLFSPKISLSDPLLKVFLSLVYGVQMLLAYFLMLLVMTYEISIFFSVVFGLGIGYFFILKVPPVEDTIGSEPSADPSCEECPKTGNPSDGGETPCTGGGRYVAATSD
eukprot:GHVL01000299.1.p1 GENE.GHVL01000299.1~~GHVL01000299.1.p1  ORF type:complete len:221 (-),score=28.69 GHVL01000299.1:179-841(-)